MAEPSKYSILVVDDEEEILQSLRGLLRLEYEVHTAQNAAEGLEIFRRRQIHVVMSDQRMPEMTGAQLLSKVQEERPETMRILFTGYADIEAVVEAVNEGRIFRYIAKPWNPEELQATVRMACAEYGQFAERERLLYDLRSHISEGQTLMQRIRQDAFGSLNPSGQGEIEGYTEKGAKFLERLRQMLTPG
ncbi:MAG: response regulator [Candidatus Tectomicrobia bacterium]|nr:response regulator [Candidatus Tectomicrobia bacterium]